MSLSRLIAKKSTFKKINEFIKNNPNLINEQDEFGYTPLMNAIVYERNNIYDILLKFNAKKLGLNAVNDSNQTVLILACAYREVDLINRLLDKFNKFELDLLRIDADGNSALDYATINNLSPIVERLQKLEEEYNKDIDFLYRNKEQFFDPQEYGYIDFEIKEPTVYDNNKGLFQGGSNNELEINEINNNQEDFNQKKSFLEEKILSLVNFIKSGRQTELHSSVMDDLKKYNN